MLVFILVAIVFAVIVVALFTHHRVVEGAGSKISQLENTLDKLEHEKKRLQGRLESCELKINDLEQQLDESERARLDLVSQLREN